MKTKFNGDVLILPDWKFTLKGGDARTPHRHRILAQCRIGREEFFVCANHKRSLFWVHASGPGFAGNFSRVAHTCSTRSKPLADLWIAAVTAGKVKIE